MDMDIDDAIEATLREVENSQEIEEVRKAISPIEELVAKDRPLDYYRGMFHAIFLIFELGNPLAAMSYILSISTLFIVVGDRFREARKREQEWIEGNVP